MPMPMLDLAQLKKLLLKWSSQAFPDEAAIDAHTEPLVQEVGLTPEEAAAAACYRDGVFYAELKERVCGHLGLSADQLNTFFAGRKAEDPDLTEMDILRQIGAEHKLNPEEL